jgi:hypothetical protein
MNENKNWYTLYIRAGREKKVAEILNRGKIEHYWPFNKIMHPLIHHKRPDHFLFNSYVFIRIFENEISSLVDKGDVINFLFWLGKPAIISDSEIETIKMFLKTYATVRFEKVGINVNPEKIAPDYFLKESEEFNLDADKTVKIMLPSLGYLMVAVPESVNTDMIFRKIPTEVKSQTG